MKIIITGGNGFLGSFLANALSDFGYKLCLPIRQKANTSRLNNARSYISVYNNTEELLQVIRDFNPELIIHTICNYGRNNQELSSIFYANYMIGINIINELIELKTPVKFLNVGTVLDPEKNHYSFSKNQFKNFGKYINSKSALIDFKNIELQHIYGPGDDENKFITYLLNSCKNNTQSINLTLGNQERDFIYIKDVISGIHCIIENFDMIQETDIPVGSGILTPIKDVAKCIKFITNSNSILNFGAIKTENVEIVPAANLNILNRLNWSNKFTLAEGLLDIFLNYEQ